MLYQTCITNHSSKSASNYIVTSLCHVYNDTTILVSVLQRRHDTNYTAAQLTPTQAEGPNEVGEIVIVVYIKSSTSCHPFIGPWL